MSMPQEIATCFACQACNLVGIIHRPESPRYKTGVLIVVGGPQTRVGSHRQFLLLARHLAAQGIAVMRFDYRAMGDSDGVNVDFESVNEDIAAAIGHFQTQLPEIKRIVIWGLCDAASAACFYAYQDNRVTGLVLLNPWVRTATGEAKAYLKHYYLQRLLQPELWKKLLSGRLNITDSLKSLVKTITQSLHTTPRSGLNNKAQTAAQQPQAIDPGLPLPDRMCIGLERFSGKIMLILSGNNDFVAEEFRDVVAASARWQQVLGKESVMQKDFTAANHTFSSRAWRDQVADWTSDWIKSELH